MEKSKRNSIIILTAVTLFAIVVVVFILRSNPYNNPVKKEESVNKTRIMLSWWGNDDRHMYTMEGVSLFMQKYPEYEVDYRYGEWSGYEKRNKVWMESHTEADVMQINYAWLAEYSPDGTGFYDLNELSEYIDLDNFTEEEKSYGTRDGKLNALPIAMNTHVFYFNQDLLDAYGLSLPESWDDLFTIGKTLSADGKYAIGMSKKQLFLMLIAYYEQNFGTQVFNSDGTIAIDADGIAFMLEFYKRLIKEGVLCPIDVFDRSMYLNGEIAGTMCWISDTNVYCDGLEANGVNVSRVSYPVLEGAKSSGWYVKPATMWAISANAYDPEAAAKLLNFLLNDPNMAKLAKTEKGVPVSDAAVAALSEEGLFDTNEFLASQEMNEHMEDLNLMIPMMENEDIIDAFKSGADEYIYDKMTLEESAAETYKAIKEIIKHK